MTTGHSKNLIASIGMAFLIMGISPILSIHAASLSIVDVNGYISPKAQIEVNEEAETSVSTDSEKTLLDAKSKSNIETNVESTSDSSKETEAYSEGDNSADMSQEFDMGNFFNRLQNWSYSLLNLLGFGLNATTTAESSRVINTNPVVKTTQSTAHITLPSSQSIITRIYYSSTSPVIVSSTSSYVTTWGVSKQNVELNHLDENTTYYYRVIRGGLVNSTTSIEYSFTTETNAQTPNK